MRILTAMIFVLTLGICAWAQEESSPGRVEASGLLGSTGFGEDLIRHTTVGGGADVRLVAGLRVGSEILYHIGPKVDRDMSLSLTASYDFNRTSRVTPFVTAVGGMLRRSYGGVWRWSEGATCGAGAGVKIALSKRVFVAPEVRAGLNPELQASVRIGYRF
jgi:hypothetical protein